MEPKVLVQLLAGFLEDTPTVSKISDSQLPPTTRSALNSWSSNLNIPIDDPDTSVELFEVKMAGFNAVYFADYEGDDPDLFRAMCVILDDRVIGESVDVGD